MLPINSNTKVYILCAPNFATGGPEALHQLGHQLNKLGINTFMYYDDKNYKGDPVHPFYKHYNVPYVREIENKKEHLLILPETSLAPIFKRKFKKIRKAIWWLSVTNYYLMLEAHIKNAERKRTYPIRKLFNTIKFATMPVIKELQIPCIGHSHYSMVHLKSNGIDPLAQISDYMNAAFFSRIDDSVKKENIIIYNPIKNGEFLDKIINKTEELTWTPLVGLSPEEVSSYMNRAKLYVDFGYHPGKERMPREACLMRCCMIIGKDGSAAYDEDMPIPMQYRFEKADKYIPEIVERIHNCIENYDENIRNFSSYRAELYKEKDNFEKAVEATFIKV